MQPPIERERVSGHAIEPGSAAGSDEHAALPSPGAQSIRRYRLGPITIDAVSREQLLAVLSAALRSPKGMNVAYVNAHILELLHANRDLATRLVDMSLIFCDGVGALLGLRLLGIPVPERMTPPDFIDEVLQSAHDSGATVFLLGDEPPVVARTAERLQGRWPGLVAGHHHGFFDHARERQVSDDIARSGARLVLVGMGTPRQEEVISRLRESLPEQVLFAVGGLFRWYSGTERRGPRWLTDNGFEWLTRLIVQPRRVARRYLLGLPRLAIRLLFYWLRGERGRIVAGNKPTGVDETRLPKEEARNSSAN